MAKLVIVLLLGGECSIKLCIVIDINNDQYCPGPVRSPLWCLWLCSALCTTTHA